MKKCGNCSKCNVRYPQRTVARCAAPASSAVPAERQCSRLAAEDLAGVLDMDGNPALWPFASLSSI
jgi:hypothetical protein